MLRTRLATMALAALLAASLGLAGLVQAGQPAPGSTRYTPETTTAAELSTATDIEQANLLTGISRDYPDVCRGRGDTATEDTGMVPNEERTDIGPPVIELERLQAETRYRYCLFVDNRSPRSREFAITAVEIVGSPDPDTKQSIVSPPASVGTWLHPVVTSFSLKPGERFILPYEIDVPPNPPRGLIAGGLEIREVPRPGEPSPGFDVSLVHKVYITFPGGEAKRLAFKNVRAPRILSRDKGQTSYNVRFDVRNTGSLVDAYTTELDMHGLISKVGSAKSNPSLLLPNAAERSVTRVGGMPWIGFFRPEMTLDGRAGKVDVPLPWVLVLPPRPFVIAFVLALLLPGVAFLIRWRRRRQEWMAYLDEEEGEAVDDAYHEDDEEDHWDHPGPP